jgi:glycosyltransferase involved in cell wall biosynthesis
MKGPLFSVVIPTRDRPNYVQYALQSLLLQSFSDFEVIVSDNFTAKSCKAVFDKYSDFRFRYLIPPRPMSMHENWEYAVSHARGEYVAVLIDKTVLRPFALQKTAETIRTHPAEVYSWRAEAFYLIGERLGDTGMGYYVSCWTDVEPMYFDADAEIRRRLSLDERLGQEDVHYYYGKICFGVYSRALIERINRRYGQLFPRISADYTSMSYALVTAGSMVDVGATLQVSLNTVVSNGMLGAENAAYAKSFLKTADPTLQILQEFPVPGLYASVHNSVAYDYRLMLSAGERGELSVNRVQLAHRVWDDLAAVKYWSSEEERISQFGILHAWVSQLPLNEKACVDPKVMTLPPPVKPPSFLRNAGAALHKWRYFIRQTDWYYRNVIDAIVKRDIEKGVSAS